MSDVTAGMRSLTEATKAQRLLNGQHIRCRVVRLPHRPGGSCAYGLRIAAGDWQRAAVLLQKSRLRPTSVTNEANGYDIP